jgi:hypothetical protein
MKSAPQALFVSRAKRTYFAIARTMSSTLFE